MTQVFRLPDLGEGLTEAEILSWHVTVGDEVGIDQDVVTVETAKAAVEVPCPYGGTVTALHAQEGQVLPVGEPLITIGGEVVAGEDAPQADGMPSGAGGEQYRTEERAGTQEPDGDAPERPLIGYGAGEGPARRRGGGRRRRAQAARVAQGDPSPQPSQGATSPQASQQGTSPTETAPSRPSASDGSPGDPPSASDGSSGRAPSAPRGGQAVRVISPLVRKLAHEAGVDLQQVAPGPTGVIRRADLTSYLESAGQPHGALGPGQDQPEAALGRGQWQPDAALGRGGELRETRVPIQGVQRIMVERLSTSRREIPDATTWVDVDATRLMKTKDALRTVRPEAGIGVLPLLARIVVVGLSAYPALNSSVDTQAQEIVHHGAVNLGFAAQSPRGLVVPVVHGAQAMTTAELAAALRGLTEKAREGRLTPAELTGGTFTLNNYGVFGVDGSTPIINHPEAAMLGVGRIVDKPWVHKGRLRVRQVTQLSFTFDHRVCDGGTAGGFLRFVADCVEQPAGLLADV